MINADMKEYGFYLYGEENEYGQATLSEEINGTVKMSVYTSNKSVQDNINYQNANYIGFTYGEVKDNYVIQYGDLKLKVLYVIQAPRLMKQVFMEKM